LRPQLASAWEAFDDAEVQKAREVLDMAVESLPCQTEVVDNSELLEMFRLQALVALAVEDKEGAVFWTIRTVGANSRADPPADLGPELGALYETWSARLLQATVAVSVVGGGTVFVDGRPVTEYTPLDVVEGQHLVQVTLEGALVTATNELDGDLSIATGFPSEDPPAGWVSPQIDPGHDPDPLPAATRRHPQGILLAGLGTAAVGIGGLGYGLWAEQRFQRTEFVNQQVLTQEAKRIQAVYGGSYAFAGVGAVLTLTSVIGLPVRTDGATLQVHLRW
jgi:hypothetical protein